MATKAKRLHLPQDRIAALIAAHEALADLHKLRIIRTRIVQKAYNTFGQYCTCPQSCACHKSAPCNCDAYAKDRAEHAPELLYHGGSLIAGIERNHWPKSYKNALRLNARLISNAVDRADKEFKHAGKRRSTFLNALHAVPHEGSRY